MPRKPAGPRFLVAQRHLLAGAVPPAARVWGAHAAGSVAFCLLRVSETETVSQCRCFPALRGANTNTQVQTVNFPTPRLGRFARRFLRAPLLLWKCRLRTVQRGLLRSREPPLPMVPRHPLHSSGARSGIFVRCRGQCPSTRPLLTAHMPQAAPESRGETWRTGDKIPRLSNCRSSARELRIGTSCRLLLHMTSNQKCSVLF